MCLTGHVGQGVTPWSCQTARPISDRVCTPRKTGGAGNRLPGGRCGHRQLQDRVPSVDRAALSTPEKGTEIVGVLTSTEVTQATGAGVKSWSRQNTGAPWVVLRAAGNGDGALRDEAAGVRFKVC